MWMVGYHHFNFFPSENFFIQKIFNLVLYKIYFFGVKFQKFFIKK